MIKYIGQHIVDFIARFRSDIYLEDLADPGSDTDKFLVVDTNSKVGYRTGAEVLSDIGGSSGGATISNDADNRVTTAMGNGNLNAEANLTWNNIQLGLEYTGSSGPVLLLTKTGDNDTGPTINLSSQRAASGGEAGVDGDDLGQLQFFGYNNASTPEAITFGKILCEIEEVDDSDEAGKLSLQVANDGTLRDGLVITGDKGTTGEVDVTLGSGAASTTTIAGGLADGTLFHGRLELGHASDTTFSRVSAGVADIQGKQIVTAGAVNVASGAQAPIAMQIARRTITQGEANAMDSTPIELIPAQGANTIIEISNVIARADRAATQTNSALTMDLHYADKEPGTYGAASLAHFRRFMYNKTTDIVERRPINSTVSGVTLTEDVNKAVEVSFSSAATTNCFTSLDIYVTYFVIDIS